MEGSSQQRSAPSVESRLTWAQRATAEPLPLEMSQRALCTTSERDLWVEIKLSHFFRFCYTRLMLSPLPKTLRVNRGKISVADLHEQGSELRFWRRQSVKNRLEGVELLRQTAHAYDPAAARLPRLLAVTQRKRH